MITSKTKYAIKALIELAEERRRGGSSLRIEEIAQLSLLREANCRYAQGYLFSRPVAAADLADALTACLAGEEIRPNEVRSFGCSVKRAKK